MPRSRPQNLQPRQFYHGSIADLGVGEHLEPAIKTGKQVWDISDPEKVYMTSKEESAWEWAKAGNQYGTTRPTSPFDPFPPLRGEPEVKPQWVYKVEPEYDVRADSNLHSSLGGYHIDQLTDEEKTYVDAWTAPRAKIKAKYPGPVGSQLRTFPDDAGRQFSTPREMAPKEVSEPKESPGMTERRRLASGQQTLFNPNQFAETAKQSVERQKRTR